MEINLLLSKVSERMVCSQCREAVEVVTLKQINSRLYSVTEMISTLNWETLEKRREKARLCMLYKLLMSLSKSQWTTISLLHLHPPGHFMVKICYYPAVEQMYINIHFSCNY